MQNINGRSLKVEFINANVNYSALVEELTKNILNNNINANKNDINILKEDIEKIEKDIDK